MALVSAAGSSTSTEPEASLELTLDTLGSNLVEAGKNLRFATLALRSCYTVNASSIEQFEKLRDGTVDDAQAYKMNVLPLAKASTQKVKEFIQHFSGILTFEEVVEVSETINKDARANLSLMKINRDTHSVMATAFAMKQDSIDKVLSACELEERKYQMQVETLKSSAKSKTDWAIPLAFIPLVGPIVSSLLSDAAQSQIVQATALAAEAQLAVNASHCVKEVLVPAINKYADTMQRLTGTFQLLASECETFANQGDRLAASKSRIFYKMMNASAKKILDACEKSEVYLVHAESDLDALPDAPTPNYVKQWLAEKRKNPDQPSFKDRLLSIQGIGSIVKDIKALSDA